MKRDMDLIRLVLMHIEGKNGFGGGVRGSIEYDDIKDFFPDASELSQSTINYHVQLLKSADFLDVVESTTYDQPLIEGITWSGHDFLDSVRDPEVWRKTTEATKAAGGFTVELLVEVAKGFIKTQIKKQTGIEF